MINLEQLIKSPTKNLDHLSKDKLKALRIRTQPGPEDMALQRFPDGKARLIISWTKRRLVNSPQGGFQYYDLNSNTRKAQPLIITNYEKTVKPHGICVAKHDNQDYLYAISHESKERIHRFRIEGEYLHWEEDLSKNWNQKAKLSPNDLFVTPNRDVYFTNPNLSVLKFWRDEFLGFISHDGRSSVLLKNQKLPNGIIIIEDQLYYSARKGLFTCPIKAPGKVDKKEVKKIASFKTGDNITTPAEDFLLIASHPSQLKFAGHALVKSRSPSSVELIKLGEKTTHKRIFYSNGKAISTSATAIIHGSNLYISQVFKNFILEVPLEEI